MYKIIVGLIGGYFINKILSKNNIGIKNNKELDKRIYFLENPDWVFSGEGIEKMYGLK